MVSVFVIHSVGKLVTLYGQPRPPWPTRNSFKFNFVHFVKILLFDYCSLSLF